MGDTFVQNHRDVAAEGLLDLNHALWGKEMIRAIEMRLKANPFFLELSHSTEAEDLVAAAVR